jgi:hypothetical protein
LTSVTLILMAVATTGAKESSSSWSRNSFVTVATVTHPVPGLLTERV